jgi:serpin B
MRPNRRLIAVAFVAVLSLAACGDAPPDPVVRHVALNLTDSSTGFGLNLVDRLLAEPGATNVFVSPLSATLMLSMAASAADGESRTAMLKALGLDPTLDTGAQARATIERLAHSDANGQLELAQAVWAQEGLGLNPGYTAQLRNDYLAQVENLDFTSPGAPGVVNHWVDGATHHKIANLVDSFDPATVAYLVNATYFHALWRIEFNAVQGQTDFHTSSGGTVRVSMMKRDENVTELATADYTVELLPYKGGRFSAVLLLPKQTFTPSAFSRLLTVARWGQVLGYLHHATGSSLGATCTPWDSGAGGVASVSCDGSLVMPKFQLDYERDLTHTLGAMGMPLPDAAMPGICAGCTLTTVVQKTHLEVDEQGTTAAAATGGNVATALRLPTVVDHPFVFAVLDNATDAPLFLGAIGELS